MRYVLSIDGGGIKGLIPVSVLADLEKLTGRPTSSMFDLIAGTSTGGILALTLTTPDMYYGCAKYSAESVKSFYLSDGPKIFSRSLGRKIFSANGLLDEKYSSKQLTKSLQTYIGDITLGSCLTKILVSAYDLVNRQPFFFKSHKASDPHRNFYAWEAALATASAPTYFAPAQVHNLLGESFAMIDGGVFGTNVAMCAYAEAQVLWPGESVTVISLGCGEQVGPYDGQKLSTGEIGWLAPLIDIVFQAPAATVDYQMRQVPCTYYRIQANIKHSSGKMDDASDRNLQNLLKDAAELIEANRPILNEIAGKLR